MRNPDLIDAELVQQYGHLLPDSLIRRAVSTAPAVHVAQADVAALADAVRRAPVPPSGGQVRRLAGARSVPA